MKKQIIQEKQKNNFFFGYFCKISHKTQGTNIVIVFVEPTNESKVKQIDVDYRLRNTTVNKSERSCSCNISKDFGVMSIPTVIVFKDGKEIKRNIGFMSQTDLDDFLEEI